MTAPNKFIIKVINHCIMLTGNADFILSAMNTFHEMMIKEVVT